MPMRKHSFLSSKFLNRSLEKTIPLIHYRSSSLSAASAVSCLLCGVLLLDLLGPPNGSAVDFLPDEAEIACRAILPQCFKRDDWAALCDDDPSVAAGHPEACRAAGSDAGRHGQGR